MSYKLSKQDPAQPAHFDMLPYIAVMMIVLATLLFITMVMAAVNIGIGAAEGWIPTKTPGEESKTPVLAEWDGQQLVIHKKSGYLTLNLGSNFEDWFDLSSLYSMDLQVMDKELDAFLREMQANRENSYVLIAVRPSGFDSFRQIAFVFQNKDIDIGYEPIEQGKRIKLKLD